LYLNSEYAQNQNSDETMSSLKDERRYCQKSESEKDAEVMTYEQR